MNKINPKATDAVSTVDPGGLSMSALWASAFVILALVVVQAGRLPAGPSAAFAGNVSTAGDLTALTVAGGDNQDVLMVLDRRMERVFVYGVENRSSIRLFESYDLSVMFRDARGVVTGRQSGQR